MSTSPGTAVSPAASITFSAVRSLPNAAILPSSIRMSHTPFSPSAGETTVAFLITVFICTPIFSREVCAFAAVCAAVNPRVCASAAVCAAGCPTVCAVPNLTVCAGVNLRVCAADLRVVCGRRGCEPVQDRRFLSAVFRAELPLRAAVPRARVRVCGAPPQPSCAS